MNKRFDDTIHHMDRRFESMDKRFNLLTWMIGLGFTVVVTIASLYNFL
jgi:cytoskeletal protein RodZ